MEITNLITNETPEKVTELCASVLASYRELDQLMRNLAQEADQQLAKAASSFIQEHEKPARNNSRYNDARKNLELASSRAVSVRRTSDALLRQEGWFAEIRDIKLRFSHIADVCEHISD